MSLSPYSAQKTTLPVTPPLKRASFQAQSNRSPWNQYLLAHACLLVGLAYLYITAQNKSQFLRGTPDLESVTRKLPPLDPISQQIVYALPNSIDPFLGLKITPSEQLIMTSTYKLVGSLRQTQELLFLELSLTGDIFKTRTLRMPSIYTTHSTIETPVALDSSGNIYSLQSIQDNGKTIPLLVKIAPDSTAVWAKTFSGALVSSSLKLTREENLLISASLDGAAFLAKIDPNSGNVLWATSSAQGVFGSLFELRDGTILGLQSNTVSSYFTLMAIDTNQKLLFSKKIYLASETGMPPATYSYTATLAATNTVTLILTSGNAYSIINILSLSAQGELINGYSLQKNAGAINPIQTNIFIEFIGFTADTNPILEIIKSTNGENEYKIACFSKTLGTLIWAYGIHKDTGFNQNNLHGSASILSAIELPNGQISISATGYGKRGAVEYKIWTKQFTPLGTIPCDMYSIPTDSISELKITNSLFAIAPNTDGTFDKMTSMSLALVSLDVSTIQITDIPSRRDIERCDPSELTDDGPRVPPTFYPTSAPTQGPKFMNLPKCLSQEESGNGISSTTKPSYQTRLESDCFLAQDASLIRDTDSSNWIVSTSKDNFQSYAVFNTDDGGKLISASQVIISDAYKFSPTMMVLANTSQYGLYYLKGNFESFLLSKWKDRNIIWTRFLDFTSEAHAMVETPDNGVIIGGQVCLPNTYGCQAHLTRFDSAGNAVWSKLLPVYYNAQNKLGSNIYFRLSLDTTQTTLLTGSLLTDDISTSYIGICGIEIQTGTQRWGYKLSGYPAYVPDFSIVDNLLMLTLDNKFIGLDTQNGAFVKGWEIIGRYSYDSPTSCQIQNTKFVCWTPNSLSSGSVELYSLESGNRELSNLVIKQNEKNMASKYPSILYEGNLTFSLAYASTRETSGLALQKIIGGTNNSTWSCWVGKSEIDPLIFNPLTSSELSSWTSYPLPLFQAEVPYLSLPKGSLISSPLPTSTSNDSCYVASEASTKSKSHSHIDLSLLALLIISPFLACCCYKKTNEASENKSSICWSNRVAAYRHPDESEQANNPPTPDPPYDSGPNYPDVAYTRREEWRESQSKYNQSYGTPEGEQNYVALQRSIRAANEAGVYYL